MTKALTIDNLTKKFEDKIALENLTLQIDKANFSVYWAQTAQEKQPP